METTRFGICEKVTSTHNEVRDEPVRGVFTVGPIVGRSFTMLGEPLTPGTDHRWFCTSAVQLVEAAPDGTQIVIKTRNSTYRIHDITEATEEQLKARGVGVTNGELAVQQFLRAGGTVADLEARYAIKAKRHGKWSQLYHLKYNQIDSPFSEEIVQDCRGLVLDETDDWRAVCLTYRKFFNHGEGTAADIHWPTARVIEKVDGSLIQMFRYRGEWLVTTSGTPDANCPVGDFGTTFSELFWKTWKALHLNVDALDPWCCYAFELCTPINRVVVPHTESSIWLHGVRQMDTLQEKDPREHAAACGARCPQEFPLRSIEECVAAAAHMDPMAQEGYVIRDGGWQRVKMKCPAYVAMAHAKDGLLSRRAMANAIRAGEAGELRVALEAFPELATICDELKARHEALVFDAIVLWQAYKGIEDQKAFALQVKAHPRCQPILFSLKKQNVEKYSVDVDGAVRRFLAQLTENAYFRAIDAEYPNRPQETP